MTTLLIAAALAATPPVRDPFWPAGYEGVRHVISAEPRCVAEGVSETGPEAGDGEAKAPEADLDWAHRAELARQQLEMDRRWNEAARLLKVDGVVRLASGPAAVLINGRARSEGDLVRVDHDGYRFVWRVMRSENENKLRLGRVKAASLEELKGKHKE